MITHGNSIKLFAGNSCKKLAAEIAKLLNMELGEIEGAMSSLSIVVCGILTVISVSIFANFI